MKRLKPGQLCTINNHVFRCRRASVKPEQKSIVAITCNECMAENNKLCIMSSMKGSLLLGPEMCNTLFGIFNYPVLIK